MRMRASEATCKTRSRASVEWPFRFEAAPAPGSIIKISAGNLHSFPISLRFPRSTIRFPVPGFALPIPNTRTPSRALTPLVFVASPQRRRPRRPWRRPMRVRSFRASQIDANNMRYRVPADHHHGRCRARAAVAAAVTVIVHRPRRCPPSPPQRLPLRGPPGPQFASSAKRPLASPRLPTNFHAPIRQRLR